MEPETPDLSDSGKNMYGPRNDVWKDVVPHADNAQEALLTAMDLTFCPLAPYEAFTRSDRERNCQYGNTETYKALLERHTRWHRVDWINKSRPLEFLGDLVRSLKLGRPTRRAYLGSWHVRTTSQPVSC